MVYDRERSIMLQSIQIKNFAIIEELTVNFENGMTVLTGETGAGKSIIIDAVSLLAGSRSNTDFIRYGCDKAVVQGIFDITNNAFLLDKLKEFSIETEDDTVIIYREIQQSKKNIIRVNGVIVTLAQLKEIAQFLIDIHGQHEHQFLMDEAKHLSLLDNYGKQSLIALKNQYAEAYQNYKQCKTILKKVLTQDAVDHAKLVLLKRQVAEIKEVNPQINEDSLLEKESHELLENQQSGEALMRLHQLCSDETYSLSTFIKQSIFTVSDIEQIATDYAVLSEQLRDVEDKIYDIAKMISQKLDMVSFDPERLAFVEERLNVLEKLKYNYGETLADVLDYYENITQELDSIENRETHLSKLQKEFVQSRETVLKIGQLLSEKRQEQALLLEDEIKQQLADLYMEKVVFKVDFKQQEKIVIKSSGIDDISFLVATNIGEPLKSLVKVASGGELSRMMLALKTIFTKNERIGTIIFDEIDTGVSGRVAQAIANKMSLIGTIKQVLCISHLPQVAAKADNHLFVKKEIMADRTYTHLVVLADDDRRYEIAKMIAGDEISEFALLHATELLNKG